MSDNTSTTAPVKSKSLALDAPGMGVDAASVEEFTNLAAAGLVGTGANNCGAVQNNQALRPDTTVTLKPSTPATSV
ncbi:hypothetical protein M2271_007268 [Streptomyces sp. LBL]|uniref:hypothetical protein n=1 Tax=Streptomyces sp. LBL TaxID=2940562 RepID=UPI0024735C3F|nr:hypothetical protein [Streptomyces sp. LBL]MDH6629432.1 hypothetical protein [Streptomyces sp. LBL]